MKLCSIAYKARYATSDGWYTSTTDQLAVIDRVTCKKRREEGRSSHVAFVEQCGETQSRAAESREKDVTEKSRDNPQRPTNPPFDEAQLNALPPHHHRLFLSTAILSHRLYPKVDTEHHISIRVFVVIMTSPITSFTTNHVHHNWRALLRLGARRYPVEEILAHLRKTMSFRRDDLTEYDLTIPVMSSYHLCGWYLRVCMPQTILSSSWKT